MNFKKENGFTGVDISIAIIILFIFVSIIANLTYQFNTSSKQIQIRGEAIEIAIDEIEKVKNMGFKQFDGLNSTSIQDINGNSFENQPIEGKNGFYKTILVEDYSEINTSAEIKENLVKKVTVTISYTYKSEEQSVNLSTILSKES